MVLQSGAGRPPPVLWYEGLRRYVSSMHLDVMIPPWRIVLVVDICLQDPPKVFFEFRFLAGNSSQLHYPPCDCLVDRVDVFVLREEAGEETVGVVIVIPRPEDIDYCRGQFIYAMSGSFGSFDAVEGSCIDLGCDRYSFPLRRGWAAHEPSELM